MNSGVAFTSPALSILPIPSATHLQPLLPDSVSFQLTTSQEKGHGTRAFGWVNPHGLQGQGCPLHGNQGVTRKTHGYPSKATKP